MVSGKSLNNSPFNFLQSGFTELGLSWKTRVFKESNFLRFRYGFSFQWNKLRPKDNKYFVQEGNVTTLQTFPQNLKKAAKMRNMNLVFPIYFEFGPSHKIEKDDYFRYSTRNKFKMGIGGYAGFNIGTKQKLIYRQDGERIKEKIKKDYNTTDFVYGLSTYVSYKGIGLYLKYDLSPIFENQTVDYNNISLGLRFEL